MFPVLLSAQSNSKKIRSLFIGNSYTYVNNLPQMIADIATSFGDTLVWDSNCPGGHTFANHFQNATSKNKIALGTWQYVILQAQSQEPSFSPQQVNAQTLPYAIKLDSLVKAANPCTRTMFYETWGRKLGDAGNCQFYPPVCTFTGMQNRLRDTYLLFADTCKALMAPAGEAWRASISYSPTLELYSGDQSHPIVEGTYLTAAVFYEMLFRKSVLTTSYSAGLSAGVKQHLLSMAHATVQDSLYQWKIGKYVPDAAFTATNVGNTYSFTATSSNFTHSWNFGDGALSSSVQATHTYSASGQYTVTHTVNDECSTEKAMQTVTINIPTGIFEQNASHLWLNSVFTNELLMGGDKVSEYAIRIVDLQGKVVYQGPAQIQLKTEQWAPGIYLVEAKSLSESLQFRVLKHVQ
jgi:hypothetical protein